MVLAIEQARLAADHGDVPVGAVVLGPGDQVLAAAHNERELRCDPSAHAEVLALQAACLRFGDGWRLDGCTLVVTLEPCIMCAGVLVAARVARVVFGAFDVKAGAVSSVWDLLRDPRLNHRPEVSVGVLADDCEKMLLDFFATRR